MDFSYSEEQQMLQDSVAKFIRQDYDFDTRRSLIESDYGFSQSNWKLFANLGWLMIPFTEEDGGISGSAVDLMIIMEEFGKGMVLEPFIANTVLCGSLIAAAGSSNQKEELLTRLMAGELQLAFAFNEPQSRYNLVDMATRAELQDDHYSINGHKSVVFNGEAADSIIVAVRTSGQQRDNSGISLLILDSYSEGVTYNNYDTVDGHRAAEIHFNNVRVPVGNIIGEIGRALPIIEQTIDRATLAICAEAVGAMEVAYKETIEYCKIRKQFGVAISSFQALQHRMADMFVEYEQARSILMMAAMQLDMNEGIAPKAISAAKSRIGKAARLIGQEAVQLHGAIGVTDELNIGHLFKRLTTFQYLFGSTDYHTLRYASL